MACAEGQCCTDPLHPSVIRCRGERPVSCAWAPKGAHSIDTRSSADPEPAPSQHTGNGIVSRPSPYSVAETLDRLESAIRAHGLTLFARIDHSGEAERVGLAMRPAKLLIFGSPAAGTPLMVASPLLALDLPLKALVCQDAAGHPTASSHHTPNPPA